MFFTSDGPTGWDVNESEIASGIAQATGLSVNERLQISKNAAQLVTDIRNSKPKGGPVGNLLAEFQLSSEEGVALLCVAEAVLRIPDDETADLLIAGNLSGPEWSKHMGLNHNWFANTASAALIVSEGITKPQNPDNTAGIFMKLVKRVGEPIIRVAVRKAVSILGNQFVYAQDIDEAVKKSKSNQCSFDMLGEGARTKKDAQTYYASYQNALTVVGKNQPKQGSHGISIKLTALHPRFEVSHAGRIMDELLPQVKELCRQAASADIPLTIDAEEMSRFDLTLDFFNELAKDKDKQTKKWKGLGIAIQAYSKRGLEAVAKVIDIARSNKRFLMPRLVKGAYWDTEIKIAQELGLDAYPVFTIKQYTDVNYLACCRQLLEARDVLFPCLATHNAHTSAAVIHMAGNEDNWEFQRLHGMGIELHDLLATNYKTKTRIYAPVGTHRDLLAYLVRRLLENGANTSFIANLYDKNIPLEELVTDPLQNLGATSDIPAPTNYVSNRKVASGLTLDRNDHVQAIQKALTKVVSKKLVAQPPKHLAKSTNKFKPQVCQVTDKNIGKCQDADAKQALEALDIATKSQNDWNKLGADKRAQIFNSAADAMEKDLADLSAIICLEGGRTLLDSITEVREAVDFLRYYASEVVEKFKATPLPSPTGESNVLLLEGKGVFLCISPWNFPLAIFVGQVAAALLTGNCVLAKPAEQTPLCAAIAVRYLHDAGVPQEVLQLLPGDGPTIAKPLLNDSRLSGVAFTGSSQTAQHIAIALASREGPLATLIAETGGINTMIVDTSALPEQVTRDVINSAFRSCGQRCSSLRMLYVQDECAEKQLEMIAGAMQELTIGDPAQLDVDIGPLIDSEAKNNVEAWTKQLAKSDAKLLAKTSVPKKFVNKNFVEPQMWKLPSLDAPKREVFGPVLHVATFSNNQIDEVLEKIQATNHALTFSLHSRSEIRIAEISNKVFAGNVYVNRNQIGAMVESNPFGGFAYSGTGPKAGGPNYLLRFGS